MGTSDQGIELSISKVSLSVDGIGKCVFSFTEHIRSLYTQRVVPISPSDFFFARRLLSVIEVVEALV